MKNTSLLIIGIFLLLVSITQAIAETETIPSLGTFKKDSCINLIQNCPNCTFVFVKNVINPLSEVVMEETEMNCSGTFCTATFCNTSEIGTYIVNGYGDLDGIIEVFAYTFEITPDGKPLSLTFIIIYFILSTIFFALSIFCFTKSVKMKTLTITTILIFCGLFSIYLVFQTLLINPIIIASSSFKVFQTLYSIYTRVFIGLILIGLLLIIYDLFYLYPIRKKRKKYEKWGILLEDE